MKISLQKLLGVSALCCLTMLAAGGGRPHAFGSESLQLRVFVGEADSYGVTSTLIYGKTEAILVDSQFRKSQATRLANLVSATGKRLKAIFITHPDYDHYIGTVVLRGRFPDVRIFMTAAALDEFKRTSAKYLAALKASAPSETPDRLPTPEVLPTTELTVDGQAVDVIKDYQGDVLRTSNSILWIPSLKAVIAGDVVFNEVHPWLADSTPRSRLAWRESLRLIAALCPRLVVAGHKKNAQVQDSPRAIASMEEYLDGFDVAIKSASSAEEVVVAMKRRYPDWAQDKLLAASAKVAFSSRNGPRQPPKAPSWARGARLGK